MSYEFRKKKTEAKPLANRWQKRQQRKEAAKQEKEKKKKMEPVQVVEEVVTWDEVECDISLLQQAVVAERKGKQFLLLDRETSEFFGACLAEELPSVLRKDFVVGDVVYYEKIGDSIVIKKRAERGNYLARSKSDSARYGSWEEKVIAANIDVAVIVIPVKQPNFDAKLTDRYLILCGHWGVQPVLCLNKVDLSDERDILVQQYRDAGIVVVETSTDSGQGIEELQILLRGKMAVLLGKSGVGKSSLVNALHAEQKTQTQAIHENSGEGRHTTTVSSMYERAGGSYIVDTPGVRMLGLDHLAKKDLQYYFPEFAAYQGKCRYAKCLHDHAPTEDCVIKQAVASQKIPERRYESYMRVLEDLV